MPQRYLPDLAKDAGVLAAGLGPLAFLGPFGTPAVFISLLNIFIFGLLRVYDIRLVIADAIRLLVNSQDGKLPQLDAWPFGFTAESLPQSYE